MAPTWYVLSILISYAYLMLNLFELNTDFLSLYSHRYDDGWSKSRSWGGGDGGDWKPAWKPSWSKPSNDWGKSADWKSTDTWASGKSGKWGSADDDDDDWGSWACKAGKYDDDDWGSWASKAGKDDDDWGSSSSSGDWNKKRWGWH